MRASKQTVLPFSEGIEGVVTVRVREMRLSSLMLLVVLLRFRLLMLVVMPVGMVSLSTA